MSSGSLINQLALITVSGDQLGELTQRLTRDGFYFTQVDSTGGLLHEARVSLLIGFDRERREQLLGHVRECCRTRREFIPTQVAEVMSLQLQPSMIEAEVGGATVYVLDVERFERL